MLSRSISPTLASPTAQATQRALISSRQLGPQLGRHLLGVVEPAQPQRPVGDDAGRDHRPGQRAAPDLVDAAHQPVARGARPLLELVQPVEPAALARGGVALAPAHVLGASHLGGLRPLEADAAELGVAEVLEEGARRRCAGRPRRRAARSRARGRTPPARAPPGRGRSAWAQATNFATTSSPSKRSRGSAPVKASCHCASGVAIFGTRIPGVSITSSLGWMRIHCRERVTPALSSVLAAVRRAMPLMIEDLPVFGMPTTIARVVPPAGAERRQRLRQLLDRGLIFAVDRQRGAAVSFVPRQPFTRRVRVGEVLAAQHHDARLLGRDQVEVGVGAGPRQARVEHLDDHVHDAQPLAQLAHRLGHVAGVPVDGRRRRGTGAAPGASCGIRACAAATGRPAARPVTSAVVQDAPVARVVALGPVVAQHVVGVRRHDQAGALRRSR